METKAKNNGQAEVNTVQADKTPKFVAGNPVNVVSKENESKQQPKSEEPKPQTGTQASEAQQKAELTKLEIKAQLAEQKPALNLEQTLKKSRIYLGFPTKGKS